MEKMKKKTVEKKVEKKVEAKPAETSINQSLSTRGRIFEGTVTRKFPKRIAIEFERTLFIKKYERFAKKKTRIHARLPDQMADQIQIGDLVQVQECRPLSKIIHAVVIKKIKSVEEKEQ